MAMYERRGSIESFGRSRTASPATSDRQKLSFNPFGEYNPPPAQAPQQVAAFEISEKRRKAQVAVAVIYCLLAAGIVFGFAAIKPVFVAEGVYKDLCTEEELGNGIWICYKQELRLNLMFTIAAVSTNVCALPVGTVLDRYGPRVASIVGSIFLAIGTLLLAFAKDLPGDFFIPGYLFLALGGPFVFIPSFQLSNTFPAYSGSILALLTGAFDTSSALFLIYRKIYQGTDGFFDLKKFFLCYLVVPIFIFIAQLTIMPNKSYKNVGELVQEVEDARHHILQPPPFDEDQEDDPPARHEHHARIASEVDGLLGSDTGAKQVQFEEAKAVKAGPAYGVMHGKTATEQIFSWWWLAITIFTMIQMLRINYFVATVRTNYRQLLGSEKQAAEINGFFDLALPLGGVVAIPFIGGFLDNTSITIILATLVGLATLIGGLGIVPQTWAAYLDIILFVLYRPFYYTAVSDYCAKVFGFETFGKVYGLIICSAGLFNFTQAGLDALTHSVFNNNPIPVNAILMGAGFAVGLALVLGVLVASRRIDNDKKEAEEEEVFLNRNSVYRHRRSNDPN